MPDERDAFLNALHTLREEKKRRDEFPPLWKENYFCSRVHIYSVALHRTVQGGEAGILYSTIVSRLNLRPKSLNSSSTGL